MKKSLGFETQFGVELERESEYLDGIDDFGISNAGNIERISSFKGNTISKTKMVGGLGSLRY